MSSQPKRNPLTGLLLTPENAALLPIDYQPPIVNTIRSIDPNILAPLQAH